MPTDITLGPIPNVVFDFINEAHTQFKVAKLAEIELQRQILDAELAGGRITQSDYDRKITELNRLKSFIERSTIERWILELTVGVAGTMLRNKFKDSDAVKNAKQVSDDLDSAFEGNFALRIADIKNAIDRMSGP